MEVIVSQIEDAIGQACAKKCISCEELFATVEEAIIYLHAMMDKERALRNALEAIKRRLSSMAKVAKDRNCMEDYANLSRAARELKRLIAQLVQ